AVTLTLGIRLDAYDTFRSEGQLTPRVNVVWQPTATTTLHAGYARYFTPPRQAFVSTASLAKFAGTTAAPEVPQNAAPRAERAHYVDAGLTHQIMPGLTVGLDGYYKQADYQLDEGQFGAPVFLTPFNYRRAYTLGIELTTTWVLGNVSAYGNLAAGQQQATGIASAQALFSAEDFAYTQSHD